jgi:hypothetical protein
VSFGVGDGRAGGDVSRGAGAGAADDDGPGACLGRDQQVTWADACVDQLLTRQAQDAVRARVFVALGEPVGEIRGVAGAESGRHEAGALDADVAAVLLRNEHRVSATRSFPAMVMYGSGGRGGLRLLVSAGAMTQAFTMGNVQSLSPTNTRAGRVMQASGSAWTGRDPALGD